MQRPEDCTTMTDLRALIDTIDTELVTLLARRQGCIDRAIALKRAVGLPARIPGRIGEVLAQVRDTAAARGADPDLADAVWRQIIEWSIAREDAALADGAGQGK